MFRGVADFHHCQNLQLPDFEPGLFLQVLEHLTCNPLNMATASPAVSRFRLQVIIATENPEGQVKDLRKFLHITQPDREISTLIQEVDTKFKTLYPAERYLAISF